MILRVVCREDFFVQTYKSKKHFSKGSLYDYKIDNLENLCDEQIYHIIDDFPLSYEKVKEHFSFIEDWRDKQINEIIL